MVRVVSDTVAQPGFEGRVSTGGQGMGNGNPPAGFRVSAPMVVWLLKIEKDMRYHLLHI